MMRWIVRVVFAILGGIVGYSLVDMIAPPTDFVFWSRGDIVLGNPQLIGILLGGAVGLTVFPLGVEYIWKRFLGLERRLERAPTQEILAGSLGLIFGLIIGLLLAFAFPIEAIPGFGVYIRILINLATAYLGVSLALRKRDEILSAFRLLPASAPRREENPPTYSNKILDTSVIIDGRIADICESEFLEGVLIIPEFVLEELRHIADSSDLLKRNRGRRGLDILNRIQKELDAQVEIVNYDFNDLNEVDSKLVRLAQTLGGKILTNDYNLNKVAELQGVSVLNINELANAVKPVVLPGEEMHVKVIKEGKEHGQGVAYLDDGTMIVVDEGKKYIGEEISVLVTSILQTAAGRMIFAKPKSAHTVTERTM